MWVFASRIVSLEGRVGKLVRVGVVTLFVWLVISCVMIFPQYLAYFNEYVGGPANGYKYLVDSNLDWEQNRFSAEEYSKKHNVPIEPDVLPKSGSVIVSADGLQGIIDREKYRALREKYEPVGRIGYNWFIFDLDGEAGK
jgi:hypothetical protein